jgi:hypothetical protein
MANQGRRALRRLAAWGQVLALVALCGCAVNRETASVSPGADITKLKSLYVVKFDPDERGVNTLIANELAAMGFTAKTGAEAEKPSDVDALVTYRDKWFWDITMYMLELDVTLRNPQSNFPLAVGNSLHTSLTRKSSEEMVKEVLRNIFNKARAGAQ